ncbi:hypothetical protein AGOR_G00190300 [Albula goreensis]|uniref:FH2 domain-containing protein n=1 Tax=Albula goreensis TaxID=1534307 RepID=A0A8T3CYF6_9TELE|nr:hypothetical protein AGOR_G00190300 [Albula goreensis]
MHVMTSLCPANEREDCGSEGRPEAPTTPPPSHSPAPNPPAPPPLPPPPPPPPPGTGNPTHGLRKKRRVRSFFWKTIPEEKVRGKPNIWTLAVRQQQYQIDVRTVEELFGQQEEQMRSTSHSGGSRSSRGSLTRGASFKDTDEISILDSKRGMNVGIFLKQFKKSNVSIIEDIRFGNSKPYGSGPLKELLKLLPESEEARKLRAFKGDASKLTLVDSFMYLLIQVPSFEVRIEAMVLKEEFSPSCSVMSNEIDVIRDATKELMTCEELHAVLHLVLQAGNIMNAGGYAGNAVGFKLSSLLSLADTKANKPGMNLLHFVALEAQKKDESLLKFPEKLQHVQSAVRISVENIESEFQSLYVRTRALEEKIQKDAELLQQLDQFLQSCTRMLQDLKKRRLDLRKEGNTLIDFFCEDKDAFKLDDCFRIFQDFCLKFKKAVKDNRERELKEAARQRRLRELEEKRSMWAGIGQDQAGGFGRSSSENDVETLTKEGLLDFLQQRPLSPHSHGPLGRSSSARRHRHTMAASAVAADRQLQSYLELFGTDDPAKFNSLPRPGRPHHRRTAAWLLSQDVNRDRELGPKALLSCGKQVTSPGGDADPLSPLAARPAVYFNSNDNDDDDDDQSVFNDNELTTVSEGGLALRRNRNKNAFQRGTGTGSGTGTTGMGQMSVSVERCTLVPELQHFDLLGNVDSKDGDEQETRLISRGGGAIEVTDLEREREPPKTLVLDTPPSSGSSGRGQDGPRTAWDFRVPSSQKEEEEDTSTVSSTTCDTPLPLDTPVSNKKPIFYILDCTETDCSVTLDLSEIDSSPIKRGVVFETNTNAPDASDDQTNPKDRSSLSSHLESASTSEPSALESPSANEPPETKCPSTNETPVLKSTSEIAVSVAPSTDAEEAASDSCDTTEEKPAPVKSPRPVRAKTKPPSKSPVSRAVTGRPTRTRVSVENQNMRKVVPLTKLGRAGSVIKRAERPLGHESSEPRRPLRDQSAPARRGERNVRATRHSSLPPEESKGQRVSPIGISVGGGTSISRWARDQTPRKPSFRKPSAKPVRNVPKPPPEEKMCRSTLRALAQVASATEGGVPPQTPTHGVLPSFARNTVASSSRTKKDPMMIAADSNPPTPSKSATLGRTGSLKQTASRAVPASGQQHVGRGEEKPPCSLRRVQSVRASSRSGQRAETPPPGGRERSRKSSSFSEKSAHLKDSSSCKSFKPTWK